MTGGEGCAQRRPSSSEETWMAGNVNLNVRDVIREIRLAPGPEPSGPLSLLASFASRCSTVFRCRHRHLKDEDSLGPSQVLDLHVMCRIVRSEWSEGVKVAQRAKG